MIGCEGDGGFDADADVNPDHGADADKDAVKAECKR